MQSFTRAIFILVALVGPACAPEDDLEFRTTLGGGGGSGGGTVFNTHALEKRHFSELTPAHEDSLGVALVDVELGDGAGVASFAVVDGALVVEDDRGEKREGAALVGSRWWVGNAFWLPQAPIEIAEVVEVDGVTHYVFVHQGDGGLVKNCVGATDGLVRVLSGVSLDEQTGDLTPSPTTTFLACTNGAIGKAAAWGYYDLARARRPRGVRDGGPLGAGRLLLRRGVAHRGRGPVARRGHVGRARADRSGPADRGGVGPARPRLRRRAAPGGPRPDRLRRRRGPGLRRKAHQAGRRVVRDPPAVTPRRAAT
ncbi:ADYC domain-containing protein [Nannocystis pusilla]|uniref:ADYC domain-containing protein n=1 Tax=Nannocystis pusilla TaxID=889268 RepID=A0A9X3ESE2_9BACT|nr:ADYC domain-containing protein [Nannocystis pusilla]MCY1004563.1 ADYC domain-containing protein [Nannocystis pusilla]